MSDQTLDTCNCCEGVEPLTPASLENQPGLSALVYRVGTHGQFKATMQAPEPPMCRTTRFSWMRGAAEMPHCGKLIL